MSFVFVLSSGYPIRHLAWLEANNSSKVTLAPKNEDIMEEGINDAPMFKQEKYKFIDPFWSSTYDSCSLEVASTFVHFFQDLVHHLMVLLSMLHLRLVVYDHVKHKTLLKKGSYFGVTINGFI